MKKQTAVEWLYQQVSQRKFNETYYRMTSRQLDAMLREAVKMEKENLIQAFQDGKHH